MGTAGIGFFQKLAHVLLDHLAGATNLIDREGTTLQDLFGQRRTEGGIVGIEATPVVMAGASALLLVASLAIVENHQRTQDGTRILVEECRD